MKFDIPKIHFSIDDVFNALIDRDQNTSDFWTFLDKLHEKLNIDVSLYLFLENDLGQRLSSHEIDRFIQHFSQRPWIKLGPHSRSPSLPFHSQILSDAKKSLTELYSVIARLVSEQQVAKYLRLHYFSELFEFEKLFNHNGARGLFTTDKPIVAYRIPQEYKTELIANGFTTYQNMTFFRSMLRIETLKSLSTMEIQSTLDRLLDDFRIYGYVSIFTHEIHLLSPEYRELTNYVLTYLAGHIKFNEPISN